MPKLTKQKQNLADQKLRDECQNSAEDIAKAFLACDPERKFFTKSKVGNFRLQTMLHISQMLYCSKTGKLLFNEPMLAYPPSWHKLTKKGLEELNQIMTNKDDKNWKKKVYALYKKEGKLELLEYQLGQKY